MADLDPGTAARLKAQIEAHPQFSALIARYGTARGSRSIPNAVLRQLGIDVPAGYEYNLQTHSVINPTGPADRVMTSVGLGMLAYPAFAGFGPALGAPSGPGAALLGPGNAAINGALDSGMAALPAAAVPAAAAPVAARGLRDLIPDSVPEIAGLAALAPTIAGGGGGDSPFSGDAMENELSQTLALQRQRMEQAQPIYDTLVNMAYGMSPMQSRGAPPQGYTANTPGQGAYEYQAPRFR